MAKAAWVAPLYLSIAWTLMITYQIFTQTAVSTLVTNVNTIVPSVGLWLTSRMDLVVFVYGFAWVFILSSAIPCVILGKERGVLAQFFLCLTLTFLAVVMVDILETYAALSMSQLLGFSYFFNNLVIASLYLVIPYVLMIALDIRSRNLNKQKQNLELLTENYLENTPLEERY
ncbi:hypothetical protein MUO66_00870 [Candidatus Bathyarchaeota archaeon]|nr:hypothetical protein [Candidatus Bathyarchaeota archaeon]